MGNEITTIQQLLSPVNWQEFLDQYWQQRPLHLSRNNPDYLSYLARSDDVDFLLATHGGKKGFAVSVIGSKTDTGVPPELRSSNPMHWTPEKVYQRLALGATVRIGNIGRYLPAVGRIAKVFESAIQTDININLYFTPRNSRAFEAHYDNHDVFILQVEGRKRWNLYQQAEQWPVEVTHDGRLEWLRRGLVDTGAGMPVSRGERSREIVLEAGDLLYIPRGLVHQVSTLDDQSSLHLTVAAPVVTWYEVGVHALLEAFQNSEALRSALPTDFATNPDGVKEDQLEAVAAALQSQLTAPVLRRALHSMADQFVFSRQGHWHRSGGDIEASNELSLETELRIRNALLYRIKRHPDRLLLIYWGQTVPIPIRCESMLQHVLQSPTFTPASLPTELSDKSRLVFCRSLLDQGFIETVYD